MEANIGSLAKERLVGARPWMMDYQEGKSPIALHFKCITLNKMAKRNSNMKALKLPYMHMLTQALLTSQIKAKEPQALEPLTPYHMSATLLLEETRRVKTRNFIRKQQQETPNGFLLLQKKQKLRKKHTQRLVPWNKLQYHIDWWRIRQSSFAHQKRLRRSRNGGNLRQEQHGETQRVCQQYQTGLYYIELT